MTPRHPKTGRFCKDAALEKLRALVIADLQLTVLLRRREERLALDAKQIRKRERSQTYRLFGDVAA